MYATTILHDGREGWAILAGGLALRISGDTMSHETQSPPAKVRGEGVVTRAYHFANGEVKIIPVPKEKKEDKKEDTKCR